MKTKTCMKKILPISFALASILVSSTLAVDVTLPQAPKETYIIQPRYEYMEIFNSELSIDSNGVTECSVLVRLNTPESYTMKIVLQRQVGGRWYNYATWDYSGSTSAVVSQSKVVTKGYNYRVQATIGF